MEFLLSPENSEEVLAVSRRVLGVEHPATLSGMNNLAYIALLSRRSRWRMGNRKRDTASHPPRVGG